MYYDKKDNVHNIVMWHEDNMVHLLVIIIPWVHVVSDILITELDHQ